MLWCGFFFLHVSDEVEGCKRKNCLCGGVNPLLHLISCLCLMKQSGGGRRGDNTVQVSRLTVGRARNNKQIYLLTSLVSLLVTKRVSGLAQGDRRMVMQYPNLSCSRHTHA